MLFSYELVHPENMQGTPFSLPFCVRLMFSGVYVVVVFVYHG